MSAPSRHARDHFHRLLAEAGGIAELEEAMRARPPGEKGLPEAVRGGEPGEEAGARRRWGLVEVSPEAEGRVYDGQAREWAEGYGRNIENYIGTVKVPVGLAGPLRMNGTWARGDFYVPLATTEAALVASCHRGALAASEAGGVSAAVLMEGVGRAPGFVFGSLAEAGKFVGWAVERVEDFRRVAGTTTRHGRLEEMRVTVEGNHVYLHFEFLTGDAAGQNMVTLAMDAVCRWIEAEAPVRARRWFVESNFSGDKKASAQSFLGVRGRKVTAEATLPAGVIRRRLRTDAGRMLEYWRMSVIGGVMSGTMGVQGHYANPLAALYLATGQDVACVAESAVGVTRMEAGPEPGSLYVAVTLPNLMVGTVGGGTGLPSQRTCLEMMGLAGDGKARALAEVTAGLALAGELSIIAALSAGHFAGAHGKLARGAGRLKDEIPARKVMVDFPHAPADIPATPQVPPLSASPSPSLPSLPTS